MGQHKLFLCITTLINSLLAVSPHGLMQHMHVSALETLGAFGLQATMQQLVHAVRSEILHARESPSSIGIANPL